MKYNGNAFMGAHYLLQLMTVYVIVFTVFLLISIF